jgi:serine phosphatase RsbU (regulator of sigma subunit)
VPGAAVSTVVCLRLDPVTGELTSSRAGHVAPLVVSADGAATWLDQGDGTVTLTVVGEVDVFTAPRLRSRIARSSRGSRGNACERR